MPAITINISNCKTEGLQAIERKITIIEHIRNYEAESFTVPYLLEHFNIFQEKVTDIPDRNYTLVADNVKRIWVRANGSTSKTFISDGQEFGMYNFFIILQKSLTDVQILNAQIADLDLNGFFD